MAKKVFLVKTQDTRRQTRVSWASFSAVEDIINLLQSLESLNGDECYDYLKQLSSDECLNPEVLTKGRLDPEYNVTISQRYDKLTQIKR